MRNEKIKSLCYLALAALLFISSFAVAKYSSVRQVTNSLNLNITAKKSSEYMLKPGQEILQILTTDPRVNNVSYNYIEFCGISDVPWDAVATNIPVDVGDLGRIKLYYKYGDAGRNVLYFATDVPSETIIFNKESDNMFNNYNLLGWKILEINSTRAINIDTSLVETTENMFANCYSMKENDIVKYFDTSSVTNMSGMFYNCYALENLNLTNFDTSSVTDMSRMFESCRALADIDLSSFDTSHVKSLNSTFRDCTRLTTLDLSSFDTSALNHFGTDVSTSYMCYGCVSLRTIYASDAFNIEKMRDLYSSFMFFNCVSLVGGQGTTYDWLAIGKTRAHIDGINGPGYFTRKT